MTCEYENTPIDGAIDVTDDLAVDSNVITPDARTCFGSGLATICLATLPTTTRTLTNAINTETDPLCEVYTGTDLNRFCVISGTSISISSLSAVGTKPLVLIATSGTISVSGSLAVASHRVGAIRGAGGNATQCVAGTAASAGQGGPGGSFGGKGGKGGNGEQGGTLPTSANATTPTILRGGCRGVNGSGAAGGNGGGAVYLIATTSISVTGSINASGAAGARSVANEEGGGGGGSGGMIALEAPSISVTGSLFANGAGAGPGNDESTEAQEPAAALTIAKGGDDTSDNGDGGDGSVGGTLDGTAGGTGGDGGGGGGGGAGIIRLFPPQNIVGAASPPPS